jgi:hypothetical protein
VLARGGLDRIPYSRSPAQSTHGESPSIIQLDTCEYNRGQVEQAVLVNMLAGKLQRLPWQLTLALFATLPAVHSASIEASNSSAGDMFDYSGQLYLQDKDGNNLTELVPLSREATSKNVSTEACPRRRVSRYMAWGTDGCVQLEGNLYLTTDATYNSIAEDDIAYISCDTYKGQIQAADVFESAYNTNRINGAVFYSTTALYCVFNNMTDFMQNFPVYSMNSTTDSAMLERRLEEPATSRFSVDVVRSAANSSSHDGQQNTQNGAGGSNPNPLGPSPSTAVAMIILYSITGIITALFLVIIITGAIRAHRHPDRYGPRDVLGRPRQSRARGLGRAILDTLPIVKFGQTEEQPKPADVELGSTAEARDVNAATAGTETTTTTHNADGTTTETRDAPVTPASRDQNGEQHSGMESGISAAQPAVAGTAAATHTESEDSGLGCSICTEDFEQGQDIRVLPCNHKFHPECVDPWLLNVSGTCPLWYVSFPYQPQSYHLLVRASANVVV